MLTPLMPDEARRLLGQTEDVLPALAAMIPRLQRLFHLACDDAPGLACIGALVALDREAAQANGAPAFSATGKGLSPRQALIACLGEAAETLSQFERPGDLAQPVADDHPAKVRQGWIGEILAGRRAADATAPVDWVAGTHATSGAQVLLPADLCLRRRPAHRALPLAGALSSGVAAAPTRAGAVERAILELVERDAAALWWFGRCAPARVAADDPVSAAVAARLEQLRAGSRHRTTLLLDLTGDLAIPAFAACSHDEAGYGLACGLAARGDRIAAATAAVLEMTQMEISIPVARRKLRLQGEASLNNADIRHLERAGLHVPGCKAFTPGRDPVSTAGPVGDLAAHLRDRGVSLCLVDHTRPDIGIPVVRAMSPMLQPFTSGIRSDRSMNLATVFAEDDVMRTGMMPF